VGAGAPTGRSWADDDNARLTAARMDRLRQDQSLLALLLGQDGDGKTGGFGGAFGPPTERLN